MSTHFEDAEKTVALALRESRSGQSLSDVCTRMVREPRRVRSTDGPPAIGFQGVESLSIAFWHSLSSSTPLYVDDLVEESELVERQTGAPLGARSRLAARVAATPLALSPNGCVGRKSRIARRGKPR
jgi:hypothetical protein